MVSLPGVELASSMAARKVQLPSPLSQIPSPRLVSGSPPIELTVNVVPPPGADVLVGVRVGPGVGVGISVGVGVGVLVGVLVGAPIKVGVGVSVGVGVRPTERVLVGVGVCAAKVGVASDTPVGVTLGVGVAVADGARVGVEVASSPPQAASIKSPRENRQYQCGFKHLPTFSRFGLTKTTTK